MLNEQPVEPGASIQNAVDILYQNGGGRVILTPGVHQSGTIFLRSNIELHISAGAVLQGGSIPESYAELDKDTYGAYQPCNCGRALIVAADAENIAITGAGEINGSGPDFYICDELEGGFFYKRNLERPRLLQLVKCRNVKLNDVRWIDSPGWTMWLIECENVDITRIKIYGDPRMINNDGVHFFGGKKITMSDCIISTGDDSLVVRAGHAWENMERHCIAEDFVVNNCVFESACQGIRVGCSCDDIVRNCRFSNLNIRSRNVGIYFDNPERYNVVACKGYPQYIDNISFDHINVESLTKPIAVEVDEGVEIEAISRIYFSNITVKGDEPISFTGSTKHDIGEIRLSNIHGTINHGEPLRIRYVERIIMQDVNLKSGE